MDAFTPTQYTLQPLRVPAGWIIGWNTFWDMPIPADGFGGSSLLYCLRQDRRLAVDVEWRPEFDPAGSYGFQVQRQPANREESGEVEVLDQRESRSREEVASWVAHWLAVGQAERLSPAESGRPLSEIDPRPLRALRIPAGWQIDLNAIRETAASGDTDPQELGLIFRAVDEARGFRVDVTACPDKRWTLEVLYAPSPSRRHGDPNVPPNFDGEVEVAHRFETSELDLLVARLEHWLVQAYWWKFEGKGRKRS